MKNIACAILVASFEIGWAIKPPKKIDGLMVIIYLAILAGVFLF